MKLFNNDRLKRNLKNSLYYMGASGVQFLFSIFTTPIFAKWLAPEDFAVIGYFNSLKAFFFPVFLLSFPSYYLLNYFNKTKQQNKVILFNLLTSQAILNCITMVLSLATLKAYFTYMGVKFAFAPYAYIMLGIVMLDSVRAYVLVDFRLRKQGLKFLLYSATSAVFNVVFGLILVVGFETGATGRMLGWLLSQSVLLIIGLKILSTKVKIKLDWAIIKDALKVCFPLILAAYAYVPLQLLDRLFLERLPDVGEFGFYSVGYTFANYLGVANFALYQAFEPDLYKFTAKLQLKKLIYISLGIIGALTVITGLFIAFSTPVIRMLTSGRYTHSHVYADVLAVSLLVLSVFKMCGSILIAMKRTKAMLYINLIGGVAAIFVFKLFIDQWQYMGAAYARVVLAVLMSVVAFVMIFKHWKPYVRQQTLTAQPEKQASPNPGEEPHE